MLGGREVIKTSWPRRRRRRLEGVGSSGSVARWTKEGREAFEEGRRRAVIVALGKKERREERMNWPKRPEAPTRTIFVCGIVGFNGWFKEIGR